MARVNERLYCYPRMEWAILPFTPQPRHITALWPVLISRPQTVGGCVGLGGWLHTEMVCLPEDGQPSRSLSTDR